MKYNTLSKNLLTSIDVYKQTGKETGQVKDMVRSEETGLIYTYIYSFIQQVEKVTQKTVTKSKLTTINGNNNKENRPKINTVKERTKLQ